MVTSIISQAKTHVVTVTNLVDRARKNWEDHKVQLMSSTISALTLIDVIAATAAMGGPIALIAALALATLFVLITFLQTLFSPPKNVVDITSSQENPLASKILIQPQVT